jgi:hypothetical protein
MISIKHRILAFVIGVLCTGLLYAETRFLLTGKYRAVFVDQFEHRNLLILSVLIVIIGVLTTIHLVKNRPIRSVIILALPIIIYLMTYFVIKRLDKSGKTLFRQDLGMQAFYLYLDDAKKIYIFDYTYPLGKTTIIGEYKQNDSIIYLDKDVRSSFEIKDEEGTSNALDLKSMGKL